LYSHFENLKGKDICLVGYYGFGNVGDDLILLSALEEYVKAYECKVRCLVNFDGYLEKMIKEFGFDNNVIFYDRWNLKSIADAINYSDFVIFAGGGIFQDSTSLKSLLYYFFIVFLAHINKKTVIIERNSIGPLNSKISKFLFSKIVQWVSYISVRDSISLDFLKSNYPQYHNKFFFIEDFVLSEFSSNLFKRSLVYQKSVDVLFILRRFSKVDKVFDVIKKLSSEFESLKIKVIVFQEDDVESLSVFYSGVSYLGKGAIFDVIKLLQSSKLVISNRLHGIILSYLNEIDVIGISIDPKIEGFCKDKSIKFVSEFDDDFENNLFSLVSNHFVNYGG
jgi:polysaccharide pyruvyl transferase CsaB